MNDDDLESVDDGRSINIHCDDYAVRGGDRFAQWMETGRASTGTTNNESTIRDIIQGNEDNADRRRDGRSASASEKYENNRLSSKRYISDSVRRNLSKSLKKSIETQQDIKEERDDTLNDHEHKQEKETTKNRTNDGIRKEINHNSRSISIDRSSSIEVKRLLRFASMSVISDHDERSLDEKRLGRAVADAGEYANGIVAVEVWILDDETGRLERPPSGWWRDESLASRLANSEEERKSLCTLEETTHPDFLSVGTISPGVDLAGELWVEVSPSTGTTSLRGRISNEVRRVFSPHRRPGDQLEDDSIKSTRSQQDDKRGHEITSSDDSAAKRNWMSPVAFSRSYDSRLRLNVHPFVKSNNETARQDGDNLTRSIGDEGRNLQGAIRWRDIHSLVVDPDTAKTPRLAALEKAGVGHAAGVHFDVGGHSGIVIYFARSNENTDVLTELSNQVYMIRMAELVGAVVASTDARRAAVASKLRRFSEGAINNDELSEASHSFYASKKGIFGQKVRVWLQKCRGGDLQIPPPMPLAQSLWTAFGAFSSLILLSGSNEFIIQSSHEKYFLLMGPIGALVTLQYGLTAAPASQPRNILFGQCVAGATSLFFTYIPTEVLRPWLRVAIAPAVSIGIMARLGIIHPPAGAASVVLASGKFNWVFYLLFLFCNLVSLIPAIVINNMSQKRQYPTYWGSLWCCSSPLVKKC